MKGLVRRAVPWMTSALLCLATPARAADAPDAQQAAAAQSLYEQATRELDAKEYASACKKLEEVTRLLPNALGAKFTLGDCYEKLGRLASAWAQFEAVKALAPTQGQTERAERAATRAAALLPRLARLTVAVPTELASLRNITILRDGVQLGEGQWGVEVPVDAGAHEIEASAPGYLTRKTTVEVLADGARVRVTLEALTRDPNAGKAPAPTPRPNDRTWQLPLGATVLSVGAAALGVGAVVGGLAIAKNDESNAGACTLENVCTGGGLALRRDAVALGDAATALFIAGSAVAIAGVVLVATAPAGRGKPQAALAWRATGLALEGRF